MADSLRTSIETLGISPFERDYLYRTYFQAWGKTQEEADALAEANLAEAIRLVEARGAA